MKDLHPIEQQSGAILESEDGAEPLRSLVTGRSVAVARPDLTGAVVGELVGMTEDGITPLVAFPGQVGSAAIAARSTIDLHGAHVGRPIVLVFEGSDPTKPIVTGVLREDGKSALLPRTQHVEVEADGERMVISAREQLVLRCGKARITLTRAGKILIEGAYISSRSSGVNRIKGGSVQLN